MTWKCFPHYWPFILGICWLLMNSQCIRPIIHIFNSFFIVSLVKSLNKQSGGQWNEKTLLLVYHHPNSHILFHVSCFCDKNKDYLIIFFLSAWRWRMRGAPPSGKGLRQGSANIPASWLGRKQPYWLSCSAGWSSSSMGPVVMWQIIKQTSGSSHMKVRHFYVSLWNQLLSIFYFWCISTQGKGKGCHIDEFVITGCTGSYQFVGHHWDFLPLPYR